MLKQIIKRTLIDSIVMTVTTTAAMMLASRKDTGSPYAAVNQICHMVDGDHKTIPDSYQSRETPLGIALNFSAMLAWAGIYEGIFGKTKWPASLATGIGTAAGAYVVDYHIVPKRFTPGIEKKLEAQSMFAVYTVLGLTLGLMAAVHKPED